MLQVLADAFRKSQSVTAKEFSTKLEQGGIAYTVRRLDTATCIELGRFCYRSNEPMSKVNRPGGWMTN